MKITQKKIAEFYGCDNKLIKKIKSDSKSLFSVIEMNAIIGSEDPSHKQLKYFESLSAQCDMMGICDPLISCESKLSTSTSIDKMIHRIESLRSSAVSASSDIRSYKLEEDKDNDISTITCKGDRHIKHYDEIKKLSGGGIEPILSYHDFGGRMYDTYCYTHLVIDHGNGMLTSITHEGICFTSIDGKVKCAYATIEAMILGITRK